MQVYTFARSSLEENEGFEFNYLPLEVEDEKAFQFNTGLVVKNPTKSIRNTKLIKKAYNFSAKYIIQNSTKELMSSLNFYI